MTMRGAYAPMLPEFDAFLFAPVGEEVDGIPLTVLSALSQLGLEPRDEAARLAHLTREAAADQLARMIAGIYDRRWSASETWKIASGLVERLPMSGGGAKDHRPAPSTRPATGFVTPSAWIYLAMALAMFVSLIASGYLSSGG